MTPEIARSWNAVGLLTATGQPPDAWGADHRRAGLVAVAGDDRISAPGRPPAQQYLGSGVIPPLSSVDVARHRDDAVTVAERRAMLVDAIGADRVPSAPGDPLDQDARVQC